MEVWQVLLQKANYSFNHDLWTQAEEYYHQAIECLEQRWQKDEENIVFKMPPELRKERVK